MEHLVHYYLPQEPPTEHDPGSGAVAHLVACALHMPLLRACISEVGGAGAALDEATAASPHLPIVRAAWRAVEGGRSQAAAAQARQAAEAARPRTFPCPVCLEDAPLASRVALPGCGDALCQPCLLASLGLQLAAQPKCARFRCPYGPACSQGAAGGPAAQPLLGFSSQALAAMVQGGGSPALQRQWALLRSPGLIPCPAPRCTSGYAPRPAFSTLAQCAFCSAHFCALHGLQHAIDPQHPAPACQAHAAAQLEQRRRHDPALLPGTQPCPGCTAPSFRDGGCANMQCPMCGTLWCWACGGARLGAGHACAAWVLGGRAAAAGAVAAPGTGRTWGRWAVQLPCRAAQLAWRGVRGAASALLALPFALLQLALLLVLSAVYAPTVLAQLVLPLLRAVCCCCCQGDVWSDFGQDLMVICRSARRTAVMQSLRFVEGLAGLTAVLLSLGLSAPHAFLLRCFTALLVGPRAQERWVYQAERPPGTALARYFQRAADNLFHADGRRGTAQY